jgi:hypothetical protein
MEDITLIVGISAIVYLLPILISIHVIKEFKLYVIEGSIIFIPIINIFEMCSYLGKAVEKISKEARERGKNND